MPSTRTLAAVSAMLNNRAFTSNNTTVERWNRGEINEFHSMAIKTVYGLKIEIARNYIFSGKIAICIDPSEVYSGEKLQLKLILDRLRGIPGVSAVEKNNNGGYSLNGIPWTGEWVSLDTDSSVWCYGLPPIDDARLHVLPPKWVVYCDHRIINDGQYLDKIRVLLEWIKEHTGDIYEPEAGAYFGSLIDEDEECLHSIYYAEDEWNTLPYDDVVISIDSFMRLIGRGAASLSKISGFAQFIEKIEKPL